MNVLTHWLSPGAMHALAWVLLHFVWQGAAIAALAALLMPWCRTASARYVLGLAALLLMAAAPVVTSVLLAPPDAASPIAAAATVEALPAATPGAVGETMAAPAFAMARLTAPAALPPILVRAWLLGVIFFSLRCAGGFLLLQRRRRGEDVCVDDSLLRLCHAVQMRLGLRRTILYCECLWLQAPAVIGWLRPVVLLPLIAISGLSEAQLRTVIAHELAHIRRYDAFVNLFQIAVETLLFYHPAVWWLNRRIRAEREHCCDDIAVGLGGNAVDYARALTLMEEWRQAPMLAMAANRGPLTERIVRVLGLQPRRGAWRGLGLTGGMLCLGAALMAGGALLGIAEAQSGAEASARLPGRPIDASAVDAPAATVDAAVPSESAGSLEHAAAASAATKPARRKAPDQASETGAAHGTSYIESLRSAGLPDATVDQLLALKIQNVTPEYVQALHALGLEPSANELVALKIQGVTPDYVRELRELGLRCGADELVALRIQGVTPDYVRQVRALGLEPDAGQYLAMRIQSVTPDYVKALQVAGFKPDIDTLIAARIEGLTPEFLEQARRHGFEHLTLPKLLQLKRMGILDTPA